VEICYFGNEDCNNNINSHDTVHVAVIMTNSLWELIQFIWWLQNTAKVGSLTGHNFWVLIVAPETGNNNSRNESQNSGGSKNKKCVPPSHHVARVLILLRSNQ